MLLFCTFCFFTYNTTFMKHFLLLPLLLLCLAATAFAADVQLTGVWIGKKTGDSDQRSAKLELYKDGKIVFGSLNQDPSKGKVFRIESTYKVEYVGDSLAYILAAPPERMKIEMPGAADITMRIVVKILGPHTLMLQSMDVVTAEGVIEEQENVGNVILTRVN